MAPSPLTCKVFGSGLKNYCLIHRLLELRQISIEPN